MNNLLDPKLRRVVLAVLGVLALALLAAAMRNLTFTAPQPLYFDTGTAAVAPGQPIISPGPEIPIWRYILFAIVLLAIFSIVMMVIDPVLRKEVLKRTIRTVLMMAVIWLVLSTVYQQGHLNLAENNAAPEEGPQQEALVTPVPATEYAQPEINPWIVYAVSFTVALGLVGVGWYFYSRMPQKPISQPVQEVEQIARAALQQLELDRGWDDAIVQAYIRMNDVIFAERGLQRQPDLTPREFAVRMERMGLPSEAIRTLTGLFEGVRYGGKSASSAERDLASVALSAIIRACEVSPWDRGRSV